MHSIAQNSFKFSYSTQIALQKLIQSLIIILYLNKINQNNIKTITIIEQLNKINNRNYHLMFLNNIYYIKWY